MTLPTRQDLNPYDDLDGRVACKHFLGKTLDEAEALFRENDIYYQEDLMWMGAPAFRYYLPAVIHFVRDETNDFPDFVAHFAGTLKFRAEHEIQELRPVATQLVELCDYIIERWSRFEKEVDPYYDDVRSTYMTLRETFARLTPEARKP